MTTISIAANCVSQPQFFPAGSLVTVTPASGATATVEYTASDAAAVSNGVATWSAWSNGAVTAATSDLLGDASYLRITATGGAVSVDVDSSPSAARLQAYRPDWGVPATFAIVNGQVAGLTGPGGMVLSSYDVRISGAKVDGISFDDASVTNGSDIVSSGSASFKALDAGKLIVVARPTFNSVLRGTIVSVVSPTSVQCSFTANFSATGCSFVYATDDLLPVRDAITKAAAARRPVHFPSGICGVSDNLSFSSGTEISGVGLMDYNKMEHYPKVGSCLILMGLTAAPEFVRVGTYLAVPTFLSSTTNSAVYGINIDASGGAGYAMAVWGTRSRVKESTIRRGSTYAVYGAGQNMWFKDNIVGQDNLGSVAYFNTGDAKIYDNEFRQGGANGHQLILADCPNALVRGNHMWKGRLPGGIDSTIAGNNIRITVSADSYICSIKDNSFDGTYGAHIKATIATGAKLRGLNVTGNDFFHSGGIPANTFPVIEVAPADVGGIAGFVLTGNGGKSYTGLPYSHFVSNTGAGTVVGFTPGANAMSQCTALWNNITPDVATNWISAT